MAILEDIGIAHFAHMQATNLAMATSAKWRSPARWPPRQSCSCSMSRPPGLNPKETEDLADLIFRMRHDYQLSVLLIEHDMPFVNRLCERG